MTASDPAGSTNIILSEVKAKNIHVGNIYNTSIVNAREMLPMGRDESVNKIISQQLDHTNQLLKENRYRDAIVHLDNIGTDLALFDAHQKARWYLQQGICLWFSGGDVKEAASFFFKAADIYSDDDRIIAARIRGFILTEKINEAISAGKLATERFPKSQQIWLAYINAKVMNGEHVQLEDIPSSIRNEVDALHMFAIAARKQHNFVDALNLSQRAAVHPKAGFFTQLTALQFLVEDCLRNPVAAMYKLLSKSHLDALNQISALFEPRHKKLWSVQSTAVEEAAILLSFAFFLKGSPDSALEIIEEAAAHGLHSKELLRINIQALVELNLHDKALALGRANLTELTCESIGVVAELAAKQGDVAFLEATIAAKDWSADCPITLDVLCVLRWEALALDNKKEVAIAEISDLGILGSENLTLICGAARLLNAVDRELEAIELINRGKSLIKSDSSESDRLMLADVLFKAGQWMDAAFFFERFATVGQISDLHRILLNCYVKANNRKKAKEFLEGLPDGWVEDDKLRRLAMELGQKAKDWEFLLPLANTQAKKAPNEAFSWLFKLRVTRPVRSPNIFQEIVRQLPEQLSGSIHNIAQLAGLELRYDEATRGLRRLYRLVRQNFEEPRAFSAYFISIMGAPGNLPMMEDQLSTVAAGSTVTLLNNREQELQVSIDPLDINPLPKITGFFPPDAPEVASLIGASVGQTVEIPETFGGTQKYTVKSIQSVYRWMVQIIAKRAEQPGGLPYMKVVPVGISGDSVSDLDYMHEEVKRGKEIVQQIIEAYRAGYLTLACLAKMQGRSPIDISFGWPSDAPPIFIGTGLAQERDDALAKLARSDGTYVIDSLTLAEFLTFGIPEALAALPKLYISPVTMGILEDNLRDAYEDKSSGMILDIDGELRYIKFDEKHKETRITYAQELVAVAHKYCEVQPAYGELTLPAEASQFVDILQEEEREMLLLAKEYHATLLTVDGRLRILAKAVAEVDGVWPQALAMHCLDNGQISPLKSAEYTIKQYLRNRNFVSVNSYDLVWMVLQGGRYIQQGIQAFKQQLQSPETEFNSTTNVGLEFLQIISQLRPTLGALGELLVHVMEPTFRHKDCPPNFRHEVEGFVFNLLGEETAGAYIYPAANQLQADRINLQRQYLFERLKEASERSIGPVEIRPIAIRVLYCTKIPCLILDKSISKLASNEPVQIGENHKPLESFESTLHTSASLSPDDNTSL